MPNLYHGWKAGRQRPHNTHSNISIPLSPSLSLVWTARKTDGPMAREGERKGEERKSGEMHASHALLLPSRMSRATCRRLGAGLGQTPARGCVNPAQPADVPPAAPAQGRTSLSVKIPPRASEIFHAFQVAAAVFVRSGFFSLKTSGPRLRRSVCVQSLLPVVDLFLGP